MQLYCQLASQLSAFSSLNVPLARHGLTIMIKLMVMCWAMLSSYLSKRSISTVHQNTFVLKHYNRYSQLATMQILLKQIQLAIQPLMQLYTQQLATNLHVQYVLSPPFFTQRPSRHGPCIMIKLLVMCQANTVLMISIYLTTILASSQGILAS